MVLSRRCGPQGDDIAPPRETMLSFLYGFVSARRQQSLRGCEMPICLTPGPRAENGNKRVCALTLLTVFLKDDQPHSEWKGGLGSPPSVSQAAWEGRDP